MKENKYEMFLKVSPQVDGTKITTTSERYLS